MILRSRRLRAAFTLLEVAVATTIFASMGLIVYGVASEGLYAFSRNVSINRSYGDARRALDRIGNALQTAGYKPQLVDATGAATTVTPAAGIRFYRYGSTPCYNVTTPALTDTSLTLSLYQPGGTTILQPAPTVGDLITISALGFQTAVTGVVVTGTSAKVSFGGNTVAKYCSLPSIPTQTTTTPATTIQYSCLDWDPVAIIAVGTQLRYYPVFIPGTTAINTAANYKVLTNLTSSVAGNPPPLPFSYGPAPSVNVNLYAEAPDYNNRNLGTANTYTFVSTAFSPRNPSILAAPY